MDFPRPPVDTGFGFHDSASCYWEPHGQHYSYARMLREHGATWYLMWVFDENKADYAKALIDNGIMPIVRIGPAKMPQPMIQMSTVEAYIAAGVKWFMLGNEYNLHEEWGPDDNWKGIDKPIRHVADWYVRIADEVRARGGWPLTPPPSLGGHCLHRDWFERFMYALQNIATEQGRTMKNLLYPGGIGIHCRSSGNPLEDGPEDYDCSAREWEWFNDTVVRFVGEPLPMANGEWGDEPGWCKRLHPEFDNRQKWEWWHNRNIEQIKWCDPNNDGYSYPEQVFANCFWVIHDGGTWDDCGMLNNRTYLREMGGSDTTPLWDALPGLVTWNRLGEQPTPPPQPKPKPPPEVKMRAYLKDGSETDAGKLLEAYSVVIAPCQGPGFYVVEVRERCEAANCDVWVKGAGAEPLVGKAVRWGWPGEEVDQETDPYGRVGFPMTEKAYYLPSEGGGPHWVAISGPSEVVRGIGMVVSTVHCTLNFVFQYLEGTPAPQPEPPTPEPPPEPYTLVARLNQAPHGFKDYREQVQSVTGVDMEAVRVESLKAGRISDFGAPLFDKVDAIAVHHLGGDYLGALELVAWEVNDNFVVQHDTCPYHFLIDKSGRILFMVPIKYVTHHAGARANKGSIAVCFEDEANEKQMESGRFLIAALYELMGQGWGAFRLLGLFPHNQLGYANGQGQLWHTACPGAVWPKLLWSGAWPDLREGL